MEWKSVLSMQIGSSGEVEIAGDAAGCLRPSEKRATTTAGSGRKCDSRMLDVGVLPPNRREMR